ncbi:hypothetical protein FRC12_007647 [Ceratobasidium sp. 428]|nr:hypothetical protein FRC12_007647 [Ceratobasidium sp. 428]
MIQLNDVVILWDDFLDRVDLSRNNDILYQDYQQKTISCNLWHRKSGELLSMGELENTRLFRSLHSSVDGFETHRLLWQHYFRSALKLVKAYKPGSGPFDVLTRFLVPPSGQCITLYLVPNAPLAQSYVTWHNLITYTQGISSDFQVKGWWLQNEAVAQSEGLVQLSTNPLGLFTTWISVGDLCTLVKLETGGDSWARRPPSAQEIKSFHKVLSSKVTPFFNDEPVTFSANGGASGPDYSPPQVARVNTETIMGSSANKWARGNLGWADKKDRKYYAEWLHIIGHRFMQADADKFENIVFGTKECNTTMMRAEAAVTQLMKSNKIAKVSFTAWTVRNMKSVAILGANKMDQINFDWHTHQLALAGIGWYAAEVHYNIAFIRDGSDNTEKTAFNVFYPYSRQRPFRFEYELDKIVLQLYLGDDPTTAMAQGLPKLSESQEINTIHQESQHPDFYKSVNITFSGFFEDVESEDEGEDF